MITATVTLEDYIAAHRLHHQRARRLFYLFSGVLLGVGVVLAFVGVKMWAPIAIWAGVSGLLGQWWEDRFGIRAKVQKLYTQFKGISEPITFGWDSEQVEGTSASGTSKRNWRDYARMNESDDVFLLYLTDQLWHVYPKRWFTTPEQLQAFRKYASTAGET